MVDAPDGNGKVTMALLGAKMDEIIHRLDRMENNFDFTEKRIGLLELGQVERQTQIRSICGDISALEKKSENWSMLNSIVAVIAGLLALFGITR